MCARSLPPRPQIAAPLPSKNLTNLFENLSKHLGKTLGKNLGKHLGKNQSGLDANFRL